MKKALKETVRGLIGGKCVCVCVCYYRGFNSLCSLPLSWLVLLNIYSLISRGCSSFDHLSFSKRFSMRFKWDNKYLRVVLSPSARVPVVSCPFKSNAPCRANVIVRWSRSFHTHTHPLPPSLPALSSDLGK